MKKLPRQLPASALLAFAFVFSPAARLAAQAASPAPAPSEPTYVLTPFTVSAEQLGRYQPVEATSGGRIAVNLMDAPQSVSVLTRELLDDVGGIRLLNALQQVAGVTESTIPGAQDRITIRGFQTDGQTVDGFKSYSQANLDSVLVERLEVVKGPNAILAPAGVPGGTINAVTRKPQFSGNFGSAMLQVGLFDASRVELDVNRVLGASQQFAVRVVAAYQDTDGFADNWKKTFTVMPMISYRARGGAELTLKVRYTDSDVQNYFGLPADPSSGSTNDAKLLPLLDRETNTYDSDYRIERRPEVLGLVTVPLTERLSMRLAARYSEFETEGLQNLPSIAAAQQGGATNPLTGLYTPGTVYGARPTFTPSAATPMPTTLTRAGTLQSDEWAYGNLQNDYVYTFRNDHVSLITLLGGAFNYSQNKNRTMQTTKTPINYAAYVPASGAYTLGNLTNRQRSTNYDTQLFITQAIGLFHERVLLNGGYSANHFDLTTRDQRISQSFSANIHAQLKSASIVLKPTKNTSVYYSYAENATPTGWPNSLNTAYQIGFSGAKPLQTGAQDEFGARARLLDDKLMATVAYYKITQNNYGVQNPGNLVSPAPIPPLPQLFSDRKAEGWEFELHATLTKRLNAIASFTTFTNRDPNDVPFRGTAEKAGSLLVMYRFPETLPLSKLSVSVAANYLDRRPGDAVSGVTAASTPTSIIPVQPTFWLPARTLVNLGAAYEFNDRWSMRLNVDNALDEDYIAAGLNRFVLVPGDPLNVLARFYYKF